MKHYFKDQTGAVALIMIIGLSVFAFAILATVIVLATGEFRRAADSRDTEETYFAAEAGMNDALRRLTDDAAPRTFCLAFDGVQVDDNQADCAVAVAPKITVAIEPHPGPNPEDRYKRVIRSTAVDATGKMRKLSIEAQTNSFAGGLNFAAHAGADGILMHNNSKIFGDVFSNGSIAPLGGPGSEAGAVQPDNPANPSEDCTFPGNVSVSGTNTINRVRIELSDDSTCTLRGNARAHTIAGKPGSGTEIVGHAYYENHGGGVFKANGETCPSSGTGIQYCHRQEEPVPDPIDLPITDDLANPLSNAHIPTWIREVEASPNPVISPPGCVPILPGPAGSCRPGVVSMGNQKINGDLYIGSSDSLTLTGNVYVTGNLHIDNNAVVQLDQNLGSDSVIFIVNGTIWIDNGAQFIGVTNHPETALNLISRSTSLLQGPGTAAIYGKNGSTSIILTAPHGLLEVQETGFLNVSMARKIILNNNSNIRFIPELALFSVPSPNPIPITIPPGGGWNEE